MRKSFLNWVVFVFTAVSVTAFLLIQISTALNYQLTLDTLTSTNLIRISLFRHTGIPTKI